MAKRDTGDRETRHRERGLARVGARPRGEREKNTLEKGRGFERERALQFWRARGTKKIHIVFSQRLRRNPKTNQKSMKKKKKKCESKRGPLVQSASLFAALFVSKSLQPALHARRRIPPSAHQVARASQALGRFAFEDESGTCFSKNRRPASWGRGSLSLS